MNDGDTVYCCNDPCEGEAMWVTSTGAPLCWTCAEAYTWGQANPDGKLKAIEDADNLNADIQEDTE